MLLKFFKQSFATSLMANDFSPFPLAKIGFRHLQCHPPKGVPCSNERQWLVVNRHRMPQPIFFQKLATAHLDEINKNPCILIMATGKYTPAFLIHESYSLIDRRQKTNATIKTAKNHLDMPYNKQIKDNVILDSGDLQWRSLPQIAPKYIKKYIYILTQRFHFPQPHHFESSFCWSWKRSASEGQCDCLIFRHEENVRSQS